MFKPNRVYRSYFGGKRLDRLCGIEKCEDSQFPEEWIASTVRAFNSGREDIIEGPSICLDGRGLKEIIDEDPCSFLGNKQYEKYGNNLSILVKLLDSAERLFIQCHPTIPFAKTYFNSDFGKTECWYILSAENNACVYIGFKPEITKEKWKQCFENQNTEGMLSLMHKLPVKKGDLIFVDGGVPHAIGGGCLLCELQEPTDYMVIPERTSKSGITLSDKKMHGGLGFDKMMDCFIYNGMTEKQLKKEYFRHPNLVKNEITSIIDKTLTDKFSMSCLKLSGKYINDFGETYVVGVLTEGKCRISSGNENFNLSSGNSFIISANNGKVEFAGTADIIFCKP